MHRVLNGRIASLTALAVACPAWSAPELIVLPANFRTSGLSGDGLVVMGEVRSSPYSPGSAAIWSRATAAVEVLPLVPGETSSVALFSTFDGSAVIGTVALPGGVRTFRYTAAAGKQVLAGQASGGYTPAGITDDGQRIYGTFQPTASAPLASWSWDPVAGTRPFEIPGLPNAGAVGISANGQHIFVKTDRDARQISRLTLPDTLQTVTSTWQVRLPFFIRPSADGSAYAAQDYDYDYGVRVRFTPDPVVELLPRPVIMPPRSVDTLGISGDGSIVSGVAVLGEESAGIIWTGFGAATVTTTARSYVLERGLLPAEEWWKLYIGDISRDGQVFVGAGNRLTHSDTERFWASVRGGVQCYANCDLSTTVPVLDALDFACFLARFEIARIGRWQATSYANCDGSTTGPLLNALDFACFLTRFRQGCE